MTDPRDAGPFDLLADFRLLLYLFIGFRLVMVIAYQPHTAAVFEEDGAPAIIEQGMSTFGDFRLYYYFAQLHREGLWPYRDYWYEFPPVPVSLYTGVDALRANMSYMAWATTFGLMMVACDVGTLVLLRRLALRLHGRGAAVVLPWAYAVLAAPVIFPWWTFEPLVVVLLLLALSWLLEGRDTRSALVTVLGTLTKYVSVLILPAVWRFYDRRRALRYTLLTLLPVALVLAGMVAWGGRMAAASLAAQANKASYESVWALIDGNMRTGRFGDPATRFDVDAAYEPTGHAPVIPPLVRLVPFAAVGLFVITRRLRQDDRGVVAFFTLTLVLFFLWAQGWSPQWALTLTPLILLNFPDRSGVLLCLVIGFISFVEYPGLFMRTAETQGEITGSLVPTYVAIILVRTAALVGLAVALYHRLAGEGAIEQAGG